MRSAPHYIQLYPTLRCNKTCGFCFNRNMPPLPDMPLGEFQKMLGILKAVGVRTIDIMGGEPTLHPDIVAMVRESEAQGFRVNVSSNGTDLEMLGRIIDTTKNTTVGISINDRKTLSGLAEFIKKYRPVVKTVFSRELDPAMIEDILALSPKKFYLLYRDAMGADELSEAAPFDQFLAGAKERFGATAGTVYCSGFLPDTTEYPELAHARCPAGTTKLGVMPDGSAYPCNLFFGIERFRLGNILCDPFDAIWNHPVLTSFRSFNGNACRRTSCELHSLCHGGCPAHALIHFGDLAAPDPRCARP